MAVRISVIQDEEEGFYTNSKPSGSIISVGGPGSTALYSQGGQINDAGATQQADGTFVSVGNGAKIGGKDVLAAKVKVRYEPMTFIVQTLLMNMSMTVVMPQQQLMIHLAVVPKHIYGQL